MNNIIFPRIALLLVLFGACLAACSGGGSGAGTNNVSGPTPPTAPPAPSPLPPPPSSPGSAVLTWDSTSEPSAVGYRVYYGTAPGMYQQPRGSGIAVTDTTYVVAGLASGTRYYFAITNHDAGGTESDFSQEISKVIP